MRSSHGMSKHPIYAIWKRMRQYCENENSPRYHKYGGRGIYVDKHWQSFENFRDDMLDTWELGLSIDRINNDGPYSKENCKWATITEQARNRSNNKLNIVAAKVIRWCAEAGYDKERLAVVYKVSYETIESVVAQRIWKEDYRIKRTVPKRKKKKPFTKRKGWVNPNE